MIEHDVKIKNVKAVITPPAAHWVGDGFRVHGYLPNTPGLSMKEMDPFLVLDYGAKFKFPPKKQPGGVGVHPHKGFETVTIAYKGKVEHHDSSGGGGIIDEGDVQWMTAGSGLLHKEFHEKEWSKTGGEFQMVQLWVNLSKENKSQAPKYQAIKNSEMKKVRLDGEAGFVEVVAGKYQGEEGPASTFSPLNMMNAKLKKGGKATFNFPANYTTFLIAIEGSFKVNGEEVPLDHFVLMEKDGESFEVEATEDAIALVVSGEPLNEPIAAHGPFVMNTRDELVEAFNDFNNGKFGYLE